MGIYKSPTQIIGNALISTYKYKWILVAYKPDSDDYCRNVHMESYSSDFYIEEFDTREELIDRAAELKAAFPFMGPNEKGFELTIIQGTMNFYEEEWIDDWYESDKHKQEYRAKGKQILKDFHEKVKKNPPREVTNTERTAEKDRRHGVL